jgi:hypothetical protein
MTTSSRYFDSWETARRSQDIEEVLPEIPSATCLRLDRTEAIVRSEVYTA